jgi:Co/Zn/Cd efflux system component
MMADACCSAKRDTIAELGRKAEQRRALIVVMVINLSMFAIEFGGGLLARSSALMADSVDMFGDAVVYGLSLYALNRGARWEAGAAIAKGGLILVFGIAVLVEIAGKIANGVPPSSTLMLGFGSEPHVSGAVVAFPRGEREHGEHLRVFAQRCRIKHRSAHRSEPRPPHRCRMARHRGRRRHCDYLPPLRVAGVRGCYPRMAFC